MSNKIYDREQRIKREKSNQREDQISQQALQESYAEFIDRLIQGPKWQGEIDYRTQKKAGFEVNLTSDGDYVFKHYDISRDDQELVDLPKRELHLVFEARSLEKKGCYIGGMRKFDAGTEFDEAVLAMRNLGFDLHDWLFLLDPATNPESPWKDARFHLKIWLETLQSLLIFHQNGLLHCDIKEDNICLRPRFDEIEKDSTNITCTIDRAWIIDLGNALSLKYPPGPSVFNSDVPDRYKQAREQKFPSDNLRGLDWRIDLWRLGNLVEVMLKAVEKRGSNLEVVLPDQKNQPHYDQALEYLRALPDKLRSYEKDFAKQQNFYTRLANRLRSLLGTRDTEPRYQHLIEELKYLGIPQYAWPQMTIPKTRPANLPWHPPIRAGVGATQEFPSNPFRSILYRIVRIIKKALMLITGIILLVFFAVAIFSGSDKSNPAQESSTPPPTLSAPQPSPPPNLAAILKQMPAKGVLKASHYAELSTAFTRLDQAALKAEKSSVDAAITLILRHSSPSETSQDKLQALLPGLKKLSDLGQEDAAHLLGYYAACRLNPAQPELARQGFMQRLRWEESQGKQIFIENARSQLAALDAKDEQLCLKLDEDYERSRQGLR